MTLYFSTFPISLPPPSTEPKSCCLDLLFTVAVNEQGGVVGTAFGNVDRLRERVPPATFVESPMHAERIREDIVAYSLGKRQRFELPLSPVGSPFQRRVWKTLCRIPFGTTASYKAVAAELNSSARAVGRANATNPICLLVPCHRVVGADGSMTGFAFGEEIKRRLLVHEGAIGLQQQNVG